ncbi:short-chain dehydrogenase [Lactobacillus sp. CBA3606]|uniref:SDR family oxidoreductase n=1 Tax=Lactobacillus sp. CBA3606 TaxID=2099789 RepID=UPI000CFDA408|nr:SDR family oxidoreductase [Lactobacillus sp. CBA3606]AVK63560.1 short-chain dehydrogenase [Lactobacillus sp. CBA3606]
MKVFIIGAHGQIGKKIVSKLVAQGDQVFAGIRNPDQAEAFEDAGAQPVKFDLLAQPAELATAFAGMDAVVFAAGSGGKTGYDMTLMIDLDGAVKSMQAAELAGVQRYLIISAEFAADREKWTANLKPYYVAKYYADDWLKNRTQLDYTILQPGGLVNDAGTGKVTVNPGVGGEITRDYVATFAVKALATPATIGQTITLINGDTEITTAVKMA